MKKRMLSALLCLCLVLALLPVSALAANPVYLALGDSITTGYKPDGTNPNATVDSPFADQIANAKGYDLTNLAANGETTSSLLGKLNDESIDVSTASLITITIGGNDMMDALYAYLLNAYNDENQSSTITLDELKAKLLNGDSEILALASESISEFFVSTDANKAYSDFESNLSGILDKIQEVNPHTAIYIATQYNPYSKLAKDWGPSVEQIQTINTQFDAGVRSLNTIINDVAANKATVVDIYTAFEKAVTDGKTVCNPELEITSYPQLTYQLTLDFHPNQDGHNLIAETFGASILAAAPAMDVTPENHTFADQAEGYTSVDPQTFTIANTGNVELTNIDVTLEGTNALSFTLDTTGMATSLEAGTTGNTTTFTVAPNAALSAGTYSAQVKVAANEITNPITISLSFTVNKAALTEGHKVLDSIGTQVGDLYATLAAAFDAAQNNGYTVEMGKDETLAAAIPAGVTLRVPSGIALTVANPLTVATGTLDIRAGATLKWGTETFVGSATDADARVQLSEGNVIWAYGKLTLTTDSQATIPTGKELVLTVEYDQQGQTVKIPLSAEIETGATLTVKGVLKAVSGNTGSTGSQVTINGTLDINTGFMTVALKARVTTAGGVFSITDSGSVYSQVDLTDAITSGERDPIDAPKYEGTEYQQLWIAPQTKMDITVGGVTLSGSYTVPAYATTTSDGKVIKTDANKDNYNIEWDGRYLTLRNAKIVYDGDAAIVTNGDLELHLIGNNSVSGTEYGFNLDDGALDIYGNDAASLVITGGTAVGSASVTRVNPVNQLVAVQGDDAYGNINDILSSPFTDRSELLHHLYYYLSIKFLDKDIIYIPDSSVQFHADGTLSFEVYPYKNKFHGLTFGGDLLVLGRDYTITEAYWSDRATITILKDFLDQQTGGLTYFLQVVDNSGNFARKSVVIPETYDLTVNFTPAEGEVYSDGVGIFGMEEASGSVTYRVIQGKSVTLRAFANSGDYVFQAWLDSHGNPISTGAEYTVTPDSDTTLTLSFAKVRYDLSVTPDRLDFGTKREGYSTVSRQSVTFQNNGNVDVVVLAPWDTNYLTSIDESGLEIAAGDAKTVFIRPENGLKVGEYEDTLAFSVYNEERFHSAQPQVMSMPVATNYPSYLPEPDVLAQVDVDFTVTRDSGSTRNYYYLTFDTNGGEELGTVRVPARSTVDLTRYVTTRSGCEFAGWFDDQWLTDDITSIYMDGNKTVYAGWDPFWDVDEYDWFYNSMLYTFAEDLMEGTGAHTFNPSANVTRGMLVTILYRLEGEPTVSGSAAFSDVSRNAYYAKAVNWAASEGIVKGFPDGTFRPNEPVTREQMATIFFRYADYCGYDTDARADLSGYRDAVEVSSWALAAVRWANAEGLVQGITTKTLVPQGLATRAQISTILVRFCRDIVE